MTHRKIFLLILIGICLCSSVLAEEAREIPSFKPGDRVLVLAPHPDDEVFGAGGVIGRAAKAGAKVKVVLLTNGENNKLSFMVYKKRFVFSGKKALEMGRLRRSETVNALKAYGLGADDVISLGYPDFGTLKILTQYWGGEKTYANLAARAKKVPFREDFSPGAAYTGENILNDLTRILSAFKPDVIFVSHPADEHRDHRALYLFTRIALWDLKDQIGAPGVYPYLTHMKGWPSRQGYKPELKQASPLELLESDVAWQSLDLNAEEVKAKYEAIQQYPSQVTYARDLAYSHARASEIFGDYPDVPLVSQSGPSFEWRGMNHYNPILLTQKTAQRKFISKVSYALQDGRFLARVELKYLRNRIMGVTATFLGYKKGVPFADMPKIEVFSRLRYWSVKDKKERVSKENVSVSLNGKELIFSLPLELLGNPDFVLTSAKTRRAWDLSVDETAWRVLALES